MTSRQSRLSRETNETRIKLELSLDGSGLVQASTGVGFLDHMLRALAYYSMFDMRLEATADLETGPHHLCEDCGLALGQAIRRAVHGQGVRRFGHAVAPMDESLVRAVIDVSGRPYTSASLGAGSCAGVSVEDATEFIRGLSAGLCASVHVDCLKPGNVHHVMEAAFKAMGLCLRQALEVDARREEIASTKGGVKIDSSEA